MVAKAIHSLAVVVSEESPSLGALLLGVVALGEWWHDMAVRSVVVATRLRR